MPPEQSRKRTHDTAFGCCLTPTNKTLRSSLSGSTTTSQLDSPVQPVRESHSSNSNDLSLFEHPDTALQDYCDVSYESIFDDFIQGCDEMPSEPKAEYPTGSSSINCFIKPSEYFQAALEHPASTNERNDKIAVPIPGPLFEHVDSSIYEIVSKPVWNMSTLDYDNGSSPTAPTNNKMPLAHMLHEYEWFGHGSASVRPGIGKQVSCEAHATVDPSMLSYGSPPKTRPPSLSQLFPDEVARPSSRASLAHPDPFSGKAANPAYVRLEEVTGPNLLKKYESPEQRQEKIEDPAVKAQSASVESSETGQKQQRPQRDETLLSLRRQGYSYKEIKRLGGFEEAESTLRGRLRVLTKDRADRVRRPLWQNKDITLLRKAVNFFAGENPDEQRHASRRGRPPWKKIGDWMRKHGSSYHFAPATCAKKWNQTREW